VPHHDAKETSGSSIFEVVQNIMKSPMRPSWIVLLLVLCVVVAGHDGAISQEPGAVKAQTIMRLKLEPAKAVLEGIALADFEMIAKHAGTLRTLMLDAGWMVRQTEGYRRQSDEFRKCIDQLRAAAEAKNIDGATLAYVQMTLRCVQCHQSLRDN
jgi:hypothetical protein